MARAIVLSVTSLRIFTFLSYRTFAYMVLPDRLSGALHDSRRRLVEIRDDLLHVFTCDRRNLELRLVSLAQEFGIVHRRIERATQRRETVGHQRRRRHE